MKNIYMIASLILATTSVAADSLPAITFDATGNDFASNNNQSVGWEFDVIETLTVSHLAWFDYGSNGLLDDHTVGIWDPDGNLLTSAVIPHGAQAEIRNGWRIIKVNELVLQAGTGYIVGGENFMFSDPLLSNVPDFESISQINYVDATFADTFTGGFERPTNYSTATSGFFGPGFFVVPSPGAGVACLLLCTVPCMRRLRNE